MNHLLLLRQVSLFTLGSQSALSEGSEDGGYLLPVPQPPVILWPLILTKWTFIQSSWIQTLSQDEIYYPLVQSYITKVLSRYDESSDVLETHRKRPYLSIVPDVKQAWGTGR